jgi:hypothetical protein
MSKYCGDKLESLQIVSCQLSLNLNNSAKEETQAGKVEQEIQSGTSSSYDRPPGSIDWESFRNFAYGCGRNISTLEIDHLNFKDVVKSTSLTQGKEKDVAIEEAGQNIKDTFDQFKMLSALTLYIPSKDAITIAPHALSSTTIKENLRTLKIALSNVQDGNTSHISEALSSCYKLEELTLRSAEQLSATDLNHLSKMKRLKRLGITKAVKHKLCLRWEPGERVHLSIKRIMEAGKMSLDEVQTDSGRNFLKGAQISDGILARLAGVDSDVTHWARPIRCSVKVICNIVIRHFKGNVHARQTCKNTI